MSNSFLPVEIIRETFSHLPLPDLQNVRLTCKLLAQIGAESLLPEAHLIYTIESIERLKAISLHPIISQYVESIFFEGDRLDHYETRAGWQHYVRDADWLDKMPRGWTINTPEESEAYELALKKWRKSPKHSYTKTELKNGWKAYKEHYAEQQDIEERNLDFREIPRAILRFPKLTRLHLSVNNGLEPGIYTPYLKSSIAKTLIEPQGEFQLQPFQPPGFRQFTALMMGVSMPEKLDIKALASRGIPLPSSLDSSKQPRRLEILHVSSLSWWWFFSTTGERQKQVLKAMSSVKDLMLNINTGQDEDGNEGVEVEMAQKHFEETGSLRKFLVSAPDLEKLHIEFDVLEVDTYVTDLQYIAGKHTWPNLKEVYFSNFRAKGTKLVDFIRRHKTTLKKLTIRSMLLDENSSWKDILRDLRDIGIKWNYIKINRGLLVEGPGDQPGQQAGVYEGLEGEMTVKIQEYLMGRMEGNPLGGEQEFLDP